MKPMLASDWLQAKVRFPLIAQPKIDGVRGLNMLGPLTTRRLKPFKNRFIQRKFSNVDLVGLDGEFAAALETDPALCRKTSSATSTHEGEPFVLWWLFDYIVPATDYHTYQQRLDALHLRVAYLQQNQEWATHLRVMPSTVVTTLDQLLELDAHHLKMGYEGTIIRDPNGLHKQGRSTVKEGGLLRIKTFVDDEAVVIRFEEGNHNANEATINELGKTTRSSHQENMIPNGQVGTIVALYKGMEINVGPGNMTEAERIAFWEMRGMYIGRLFTFKHFPQGVKEKPRFPTWKCWRDESDTSD